MAVVYLAVSFLASLAVSISVYEAFGSLTLSFLAYATTGVVILFCVLLAAFLREQPVDMEPNMIAAE